MKRAKRARRTAATAGVVVALLAGVLAFGGAGAASAQEPALISEEEVTTQEEASCEVVDLGALDSAPGSSLEASGRWTTGDCDSRFRLDSDAHTYRFEIADTGRIRIDLNSSEGDSFLYLLDEDGKRITENDDGGVGALDARIERELLAGVYLIEATTFRTRDLQGPRIDFTLTLTIVEDEASQHSPLLKIEEIDIPTEVVAGDPLPVNYRIGNAGGDEFPDQESHAILYAIGPRVFDRISPVLSNLWPAGASYHTNEATASATSTTTEQVAPHSVTFDRTGPTWVFTAVITRDGNEDEIGFHGLWHDLLVLSNPTYDPVQVEVDGVVYSVSAELDAEADNEDEEGTVVTTVSSVDDPEAEIDAETQEKAQFAAGVRTQLLDGIFDRPAITGLPESADLASVTVTGPASSGLLQTAAPRYAALVRDSGLLETLAAGEAISPIAVEQLVLAFADGASGSYAYLAESWRALLERIDSGGALSFEEASAVQAQLAYVEYVIAPVVAAGEIVDAAQAAELGWDDPEVQAMLSGQPSCYTGEDPLSEPLALADIEDTDALEELDAEMRAAQFAYTVAIDNVLCAVENVDAANHRFLERLGLDQSEQLLALIEPESLPEPEEEPEPDPPIGLRVMARLGEDDRIEHGVELSSGFQIQPERRYLPADTQIGTWYSTLDVELNDTSIGQIRARRLADGRVQLGFSDFRGHTYVPDIAYLPADIDDGVWYRSSLIEVPRPPEPAEDEEEDG